jgi:Zn finger protein HypA/HybF involved in hydrogenase expression
LVNAISKTNVVLQIIDDRFTITMHCSGWMMNFSGRSQSLGDISGRGGTLDREAASHAHPLASTSGTFLANTSAADVPDIFSHGSPIGEDSHPDDSGLDSDDGDELCSGSTTVSASAAAGAAASAHGSSYVPDIKVTEDTVSNMDTSINTSANSAREHPLDAVYYQCRSARIAKTTTDLISISRDSTFGQKVTSITPSIGTFEDHTGIEITFHSSRFQKGTVTVNQSISASFDPAKLVCVSCSSDHPVVQKNPIVVFFTDQNFVPTLSPNCSECINVVRIENASLIELFEISKEIFGNSKFPDGTILCFGSVSHLNRVGTSIYARDWNNLISFVSSSWRGIRVCPLIPLIVSDCPGTLARELTKLGVWLTNMYSNNPLGLQDSWSALLVVVEKFSTGSISLPEMDSYKVPLPSSLDSLVLDTSTTFCCVNSRPITLMWLSKDDCNKLLGVLIGTLHFEFKACPCPESFLARANVSNHCTQSTEKKNVVLCGASNLCHCKNYLTRAGMTVTISQNPDGLHPKKTLLRWLRG